MIRQGKGMLTIGEEDSAGLWALMLALLHPECMKGYGRERKKCKSTASLRQLTRKAAKFLGSTLDPLLSGVQSVL